MWLVPDWNETVVFRMKVTVLGSGDAFGSGGRRQSSYLVQGKATTFLMDAGPTVTGALCDAGVASPEVDFALISHLHGDHFGGLPFLIMEYLYNKPRDREFTICGPEGTEERVQNLYRAMYLEASSRPLTFPVTYRTVRADEPLEIHGVLVEPFAVPHQELQPSMGYRVTLEGKTILYSGDSGWTEEFVERTAGVDLFICECCYFETQVGFHVNYPELEKNRHRLQMKRLIITHLGREVLDKLDRVTIERARDGMVIEV